MYECTPFAKSTNIIDSHVTLRPHPAAVLQPRCRQHPALHRDHAVVHSDAKVLKVGVAVEVGLLNLQSKGGEAFGVVMVTSR